MNVPFPSSSSNSNSRARAWPGLTTWTAATTSSADQTRARLDWNKSKYHMWNLDKSNILEISINYLDLKYFCLVRLLVKILAIEPGELPLLILMSVLYNKWLFLDKNGQCGQFKLSVNLKTPAGNWQITLMKLSRKFEKLNRIKSNGLWRSGRWIVKNLLCVIQILLKYSHGKLS